MLQFAQSVFVPFPAARPQPDQVGIGCCGLYWPEERRGLVLIVDGKLRNTGASATNAMRGVLQHLQRRAPEGFVLSDCDIVERDSLGLFDLVHFHLRDAQSARLYHQVGFSPLLHPPAPARSAQAFESRFGDVAAQAWALVSSVGPYEAST